MKSSSSLLVITLLSVFSGSQARSEDCVIQDKTLRSQNILYTCQMIPNSSFGPVAMPETVPINGCIDHAVSGGGVESYIVYFSVPYPNSPYSQYLQASGMVNDGTFKASIDDQHLEINDNDFGSFDGPAFLNQAELTTSNMILTFTENEPALFHRKKINRAFKAICEAKP